MPNVVNESVEEAQSILEAGSLAFKITDKQFSEEIPKDRILSQSVQAGKIVEQGSEVSVVVSGGSKTQENGYELAEGEAFVPDVQYKSLEEAQQLITEAGLTADVQYRVDNSVEVGRVIGQELAAGEVVAQGSTLTFYVSEDEEAEPEEESEPGEEPEAAPEPEPQDNAATQATTAPPQNDAGAETEIPDASGGSFTPGYGESMLTYINQYRTEAGVAPLAWDTGLAIEAQQIAIEKEKDRETTFHGSGLSMWMFNIGSGTAEESVQAIMRSTAKDVLLDAKLTVIGAARYITASGEYYYTFAYR